MTVSKNNSKSHLSRGSLYDDYLKKNHPENIRKTMLKKSLFSSNISKINEGIKENESESENEKENEKEGEEDEKDKEKEKKENEELKKSLKLKYSLSFEDDDDNEENEDDISLNNKEDDLKLFNLLDNENDEEMKELKKIYFNGDVPEKKEKEAKDQKEAKEVKEVKEEIKKPKSIMKKKSVKFNTGNAGEKDKPKEKTPDLQKSINTRMSINSNNNDKLSNSVLEGLDKYEEKLKEINKNYQITNDKEDTQHMKFYSQFEISFHDDFRF